MSERLEFAAYEQAPVVEASTPVSATYINGVNVVLGDPDDIKVRRWLDEAGRERTVLAVGPATINPNHCTSAALRALAASASWLADWVEEQTGVTA